MSNKTKICPKCRTEIDYKASICPNCKSKLGSSLGTLLIIIFIWVIIMGYLGSNSSSTGGSVSNNKYKDCTFYEKDKVKNYLKSPSTAKIVSCFKNTENGKWDGTVDAQNSFGALIRNNFICTNDECVVY